MITPIEWDLEEIARQFNIPTIEINLVDEKISKPIFAAPDILKTGKDTNLKYVNLINLFFKLTKEFTYKVKSVEKFAKVFFIRFYDSRPQFYSFTKSDLTKSQVDEIPVGVRFDIEDFFKLTEDEAPWRAGANVQETILSLSRNYCMRRLVTYPTDREGSQLEYAELTPEGKLLPDWFIYFKEGVFEKLTRKEQLVAYLNNYQQRYEDKVREEPKFFDYVLATRPSFEVIKVHKFYRPK